MVISAFYSYYVPGINVSPELMRDGQFQEELMEMLEVEETGTVEQNY